MKAWSKKHTCCLRCSTTQRKHKARGHCQKCYWVVFPPDRAKVREWQTAYIARHPDRRRETATKARAKFKQKHGVNRAARWFIGVEVIDALLGTGTVQGVAKRIDGDWTVPVKFGGSIIEMPTRELTRTGYWE
jgi:predicted ATP-dependent serine protease